MPHDRGSTTGRILYLDDLDGAVLACPRCKLAMCFSGLTPDGDYLLLYARCPKCGRTNTINTLRDVKLKGESDVP